MFRTISIDIFIVMDKEKREVGDAAMKRQKLNYRFHNPNTAEVTADYILKVFIEANMKKVERAMQEAAKKIAEEEKQSEK